MSRLYSLERLLAFGVMLLAYWAVFGLLWWADSRIGIGFPKVDGFETALISMPFVSLYIVILLGVAAGYARAAFTAKALGLTKAIRQQLRSSSMEDVSIKSKIRSDSMVTMDTPLLRTLEKVVTARLPILPVIENEKVTRVVTMHNIMQELTHQINNVREEDKTEELFTRLFRLKIGDLRPRPVISCKENDNLELVMSKMMRHQFTKLVVVGRDGETFLGSIDLFDITSELLSERTEE